jgi:hypothetical protein
LNLNRFWFFSIPTRSEIVRLFSSSKRLRQHSRRITIVVDYKPRDSPILLFDDTELLFECGGAHEFHRLSTLANFVIGCLRANANFAYSASEY